MTAGECDKSVRDNGGRGRYAGMLKPGKEYRVQRLEGQMGERDSGETAVEREDRMGQREAMRHRTLGDGSCHRLALEG